MVNDQLSQSGKMCTKLVLQPADVRSLQFIFSDRAL